MKIKAIDAECKNGMVAVELAYISSCKQLGTRTLETGRVISSAPNSTAMPFAAMGGRSSPSSIQVAAH